jgi:hypothetical protein
LDNLGPTIAAELERVKKELQRHRSELRRMRLARDRWRAQALELSRQANPSARWSHEYRERKRAAA